MINLNFNINKNQIKLEKKEFVTTGSINQIECEFKFLTEDWTDLDKTAIFKINNIVNKIKLDSYGKCFIPAKALEKDGELYIGVFGEKIENSILTKRNTTGLIPLTIYEGSFI